MGRRVAYHTPDTTARNRPQCEAILYNSLRQQVEGRVIRHDVDMRLAAPRDDRSMSSMHVPTSLPVASSGRPGG